METRTLGRTGVKVTPLCLGAMMFGAWGNPDHDESIRVIHRALDAGINFIDTADVYSAGESEEIVGKALTGGRRDDVVLATKFHGPMGDDVNRRGNSRRWIMRSVEDSLRRLQTDWIDLYQYHSPDGVTPVEETLEALHELVLEGKVRAIGSSNFTARQIQDAHKFAAGHRITSFATEQSRYSWLSREAEDELLPTCERLGIGFIPYSPLANGLLTGKYRRGEPPPAGARLSGGGIRERDLERVEHLQAFARERGASMLDLAIGGLAAIPSVSSVIAGATRPEQVRANAEAGEWQPSAEELAALRAI
jgi:aryl-alcohol dehydrogenase-like predicted oxidoreductase